jgi:hypothetical protein
MHSDISRPRRNALIAAGAGIAAGLLNAAAGAQTQTPVASNGIGPSTAAFNGKLYAVWRDPGPDAGLWYASFDGAQWSAKTRIARTASSESPALAAFDNKLHAVWKGKNEDQRLWHASFDGLTWTQQAQIPGAISASAPSLSVFNRKLYAVWKASGSDPGLVSAAFDGSAWSSLQNAPQPASAPIPPNAHPFTPQMIASSGLAGAGGVDQGKYNDCVFEASVAAVAMTPRGQLAISQAILQNPDGSFTVTFPGAAKRPIMVTQSDLKTTRVHDSATWAAVLEAALIVSDPNFANGSHPPPDATGAADGSRPTPAQYALHLLTGSAASKDLAWAPRIVKKIAQALGNGQPVVAFCANNDEGALVSGHEWTLMACDPQANRITLRNPWGNFKTAGTSKAGVAYDGNAEVTMTPELFGQFFKEITFGYSPA